jgi:serine/threonine protein kinase
VVWCLSCRLHPPPVRSSVPTGVGTLVTHGKAGVFASNFYNILFRSVENAWEVPKVADWGLSKHLLEHSKSIEGMSPHYAAPEQFDDDRGPVDDITDIYQLGAVFYELFTGRPPFEGQPFQVMKKVETEQPTPPSELADLPPAIDEILLTALAKEKADRYEDILLLRNAFEDVFNS